MKGWGGAALPRSCSERFQDVLRCTREYVHVGVPTVPYTYILYACLYVSTYKVHFRAAPSERLQKKGTVGVAGVRPISKAKNTKTAPQKPKHRKEFVRIL